MPQDPTDDQAPARAAEDPADQRPRSGPPEAPRRDADAPSWHFSDWALI